MYTENETFNQRHRRRNFFRRRRSVDLDPLKSVRNKEEKTMKTNQVNIENDSRVFALSVLSARFVSCFATRKIVLNPSIFVRFVADHGIVEV